MPVLNTLACASCPPPPLPDLVSLAFFHYSFPLSQNYHVEGAEGASFSVPVLLPLSPQLLWHPQADPLPHDIEAQAAGAAKVWCWRQPW